MSAALTAVCQAVSDLTADLLTHGDRSAQARLGQARHVATLLDDLDPLVGEETRRNLWIELGRSVAGGGWLMGAQVSAGQARAACLEALAAETPRRRGRPAVPGRERVETMLYPAEVAQVEALIGTVAPNRSDVIATLVRRALATREA